MQENINPCTAYYMLSYAANNFGLKDFSPTPMRPNGKWRQ